MIRSHRIRLNLTPEQAEYFARAAGTRRFVFNWGLAEWKRQFEVGEKPSAWALKKQFNAINVSRICSHSGHVKQDLSLSERTFVCPDCGFTLDRDLNAALNILNEALSASRP